jgi:8-amino-7-oxononanoate synthase
MASRVLTSALLGRLADIEAQGLTRNDEPIPSGLLSVCGNDYLGLRHDPALRVGAEHAMRAYSTSASASRLVGGSSDVHLDVESQIAGWLGAEAALVFPSGYQANVALLSSLPIDGDLVVSDALNHASVIDGLRLSRARRVIVPHRDVDRVREALAAPCTGQRFVVTESLFSMDGDVAPLKALEAVCREAGAALIVDEAHAIGVRGPQGRGLAAELGVRPDVTVIACGKAMGAAGGVVCGSHEVRRWLVNRGRGFIYSTGLAPALAGALGAAVEKLKSGDAQRILTERREQWALAFEAHGLRTGVVEGAIAPIIVGPNDHAMALAAAMRQRGFFVQAIRPPTVPVGTARLRITISAAYPEELADRFCAALRDCTTALDLTLV